MSTCFFVGHRDTRPGVWGALVEAVERHIVDYGVDSFTVGYYGRIAYAWYPGNARELVEYAQARAQKGLIRIENLADKA